MPKQNPGPHLHWRKDRGAWYIRWFEGGQKRQKSTGFGRGEEASAREALADLLVQGEERLAGPSRANERTIADVLTNYANEHAPNTADPIRISYAIDALIPFWGDKSVGDVTEKLCREYVLYRKASPGTVRRELSTLRASMNWDFRHNRLERVPHVWLPQKPEPKDRWLTRPEVARLLRGARNKEPQASDINDDGSLKEGYAPSLQRVGRHVPLFILIAL